MGSLPYPLHPLLVHFPIALFISAFIFEWLGIIFKREELRRTALILYVSATIIVPLVYWTGHEEAEKLKVLGRHQVVKRHEFFATCTMWMSLASLPVLWFVHKKCQKTFTIVFLIFSLATVALVATTGHFGGRMVYEYGLGVE